MIVFVLIFVLLQLATTSKLYEGDRCIDTRTRTAGCCCMVHLCRSAQDDLRAGHGPTLCSFVGKTPVVCCRHGCAAAGYQTVVATERIPAVRISEIMCAEYDKMVGPSGSKKIKKRNTIEMRNTDRSTNQNNGFRNKSNARVRRQRQVNLDDSGGGCFFHIEAVGGVDTEINEFPHMAAIGWPLKTNGYAFNCGGSLISERYVLTAGHCLSNGRDTTLANAEPSIVRLGDQNILDTVVDGAQPMDVPIARRIKHPRYNPPSKYFDIALLKLQNSVPFSEHIKPACLWTKNDFETHSSAIVTGWGTTVSGGRVGSQVLQKVKLDILETDLCQTLLQSSRNRNWQGFSDHQLCAGVLQGGKDACQGDSGGPLQVKSPVDPKKYYLIGVTSFGRESAKPNLPGVYTRVSAFLDWIEPIVWPSFK